MTLSLGTIIKACKKFFSLSYGSIAHQLTRAFILLGITATLVITAIQTYRDFQIEINQINTQLEEVKTTDALSITSSLWHFSERQISIELRGLLNKPGFEYAEVSSIDGNVWSAGKKITSNVISLEIPLSYSDEEEPQILGSLLVIANKQPIYDRVKKQALETLVYFGVWVTLLAGSLFLIIRQLVTRHLKKLAQYTSSISFDSQSLSRPLILDRQTSTNGAVDELGQVVIAINEMQTQLVESIEELQKLSRAVESSSSAVYITDLAGRIEYINPKFTEITGYTNKDVKHRPTDLLNSGQTPAAVYEDLWSTISSGGDWKGELYNRKKDGSYYWARLSITSIKDLKGDITHYVAIQEDVTHEYELSERLNHQASHDSLTDLINRREFERRAEMLLLTIKQDKFEHALCYLDLDQFKVVNDTCGHTAGDKMLCELSAILKETVRSHDTLARLGGDEFGVLVEHCTLDDAKKVAATLQQAIQNYQFLWEEHSFKVGVSIGLVAITEAMPNLGHLLKSADAACYMAKDLGRNRVHVYHDEDAEIAQRQGEMQWVTKITDALEEDRFCLYAQTIAPLGGSTGEHYELLVRMIDEQGNIVSPGAFMPAAERYGLISKLDHWIVEHVFTLLGGNPVFLDRIDFVSINLSGPSLTDTEMLSFITGRLKEIGLPSEKICFEVTETAAITNLGKATEFIRALKEFGCRFALDDFGSGLSSFGYLKNLPVDYLKIDGMFVKNIVEDKIDRAMVKSINEIGQVMGMETIAEFVENDEIKGMLREIGVNFAQGYGIAKPIPFDDILAKAGG
jgi:diguanylate cyclase (GGDEF)-like protein/PAS domain S-box-containing protein